MDELPRDARAMLALAKSAHDPPDPSARERVRARVLSAVAPPALGAGQAALARPRPSPGPTGFGSTKVMLASALMLLAVGGGVWSLRAARHAHEQPAVTDRPRQAALGAIDTADHAPLARTPSVEPAVTHADQRAVPTSLLGSRAEPRASTVQVTLARGTRARRAGVPSAQGPSLRAELGLLARAAAQLESGDTQAALAALAEHQRRFAHTQLAQEREGLWVMAHCRQQRAGAQRAARAFLAHSPTAVLATRVERACGL